MNYKYLVSILIPNYNSENYIEQTILSCVNQTYKNIEIILVDDGSKDGSFNIAKKLSNIYPNLFVYQQENKGAPAARNLAFEKSKGNYIQYLDADDILDKNKIESQMKLILKQDDAIVFGNCELFYNDIKNSIEYNPKVLKDFDTPKDFLVTLWSNATSIYPHAYLIPRNLVDKVNGWDESILKNQDGVFFAKIASVCSKIFFDKDSLVYYRLDNQNSISRKKSPKSEESRLKSFVEYEKIFKNNMTNKAKKALAIQYSYFIFSNYPENKDLCKFAQNKIETFGFKKPINLDIKIYKLLSPVFGIYGAIYIHKKLSQIKQTLKGLK